MSPVTDFHDTLKNTKMAKENYPNGSQSYQRLPNFLLKVIFKHIPDFSGLLAGVTTPNAVIAL